MFSENLQWDHHLSIFLKQGKQKPADIKRSVQSETKMSKSCNLVKSFILLVLFGSNIWFASKALFRKTKKVQIKNLKWIRSSSHFTIKENNYCFWSIKLFPILYHLVFMVHVVLKKLRLVKFHFV